MRNSIVFGGGGGKGAYQIGVWKALKEAGLDDIFDTVIGTSVGALNAALFTQGNYGTAESVWQNMSNDKIMTSERMTGKSILTQTGLKNIIKIRLSESLIRQSSKQCYVCAACTDELETMINAMKLSIPGFGILDKVVRVTDQCMANSSKIYGKYFLLNELDDETMCKALLASAALPIAFEPVVINNHVYRDGGLIAKNTIPYRKAVELGCRRILTVSLDKGISRFENVGGSKVFHLCPSKELGGMVDGVLDFSARGALLRMTLGYNDAMEHMQKIESLFEGNKKCPFRVPQELIDRLFE